MGMNGRRSVDEGSRGSSPAMVYLFIAAALLLPSLLVPASASGGPLDPDLAFTEQLSYATFIGGNGEEGAQAIVCDAAGNVFITGYTRAGTFPTTAGAYDTVYNGGLDIFVAKLDANGSNLLWSTFVGGTGHEWGFDIALDSSGNVVVSGTSSSTDFPTDKTCYDDTHNGDSDIVVFKLDPNGTRLLSSTYIGGSDYEKAFLYLDPSDDVYLTGHSYSTNYPTTANAYDRTADGSSADIIVTKVKADLSDLVYSTYLGGSGYDACYGPGVVDAGGSIWVTGESTSTDFPTTTGCYESTKDLYNDAVVFRLNATGGNLTASTYIGGSYFDHGKTVALDPDGNVVFLGTSSSSDFPVTSGAFDTTSGGSSDAIVSVFDQNLTKLLRSTYLGGSKYEYASSLHMDSNGMVYVAGYTKSTDFPIRADHYDDTHNGAEDVFIARLNSDLGRLHNSTYIGGMSSERAHSMDLGASNDIYLAGYTYSTDFPATNGSYDTSHNWDMDAIALKFKFPPISDRDNDGVFDIDDAFPNNPYEHKDTDGDGMGDNLDPDADGDGTPDERDAFPLDKSESRDTDADGTGDNADADDDNDGVNDTKDAFPKNPFEFADADEDGIGDNLDPDDDNDGVSDEEEMRAVIRKGLGTVTTMATSVQTSLENDLDELNRSLHGAMADLDSDFLDELNGLDSALAKDIHSSLLSISMGVSNINGTVTGDLDDLERWLDGVLAALEVQMTSMNTTLTTQMDGMDARTEDLHDTLSDDLFLLMVGLGRVEEDLGEENADIRADIKTLSEMTASLEEHTLSELGAVIDRLAANVSVYDEGSADDLAALSAEIAAFRSETEEGIDGINQTLEDLATLATILDDLNELERSLDDAQDQLDASVHETSDDQLSKTNLNLALIVIAMFLIALMILLLIRTGSPSAVPAYRPRKDDDIIVSVDDDYRGGG